MTLKDIAKLADVSSATVSYVLNNSAPVSEKTREKVLKIVQETGYTSNTLAKSLRISKTNTIGIVVEDITFSHTAAIIDGINEFAEQHGYNTVLNNLRLLSKIATRFESIVDYKENISATINVLLGMQVDGIIYIGVHDRNLDGIIEPCTKPFVYCYCYTNSPDDVCVCYDNFNISYQLTKKLIEKGHRRIGLITGNIDSVPSHQRMMGFQKALMDCSIPLDLNYVKNGEWLYKPSKKVALELLNQKNPPTAIYAMNDVMALGVYRVASLLGIQIPTDLSVVGFDNAECIRYVQPGVSTVDLPLREMGNVSAQNLLTLINGGKLDKYKLKLPCTFIERESIDLCQQ